MSKLVVKGVVFLLGFFLIVNLLATIAQSVDPDGKTQFLTVDKERVSVLLTNANKAEAVVVGNSHGDDIILSYVNYDEGYQLSRAWGDLFEIEYYLYYFVPRLPNLKVVFIPVSYFTFSWDNASVENLTIRRKNMYSTVPSWRFVEGDMVNFINGRFNELIPISTIVREDNWKGVFYHLLDRSTDTEPIKANSDDCFSPQIEDLVHQGEQRAQQQVEIGNEISSKRPTVQQDAFEKASEIIEYLQGRGIRVIFFTPPYYEAYTTAYQRINPQAIPTLYETMQKLQQLYSVEYYDFSTSPDFVGNHQLFKDSDHLNFCGAQRFSTSLEHQMIAAVSETKH